MEYLLYAIVAIVILTCLGFSIFLLSIIHGGMHGAPFVPSNKRTYQKMIQAAGIKKGNIVYDLGCGDGRLVFAAADKGAHAIGIEINLFIYYFTCVKQFLFRKKGCIKLGNIHTYNLKNADIVFCYLLPTVMKQLDKKFRKELKKECKVISHAFPIPGWNVIKKIPINKKDRTGSVWVQIKP